MQTPPSVSEIVGAAARAGARPDPLLTISQWADQYRTLSQRASSEPGRWRTDRTPYLREIMDCLSPTSPMEHVVFMKGAQIGGTECGNNWIGYVIHQAPGPMMAVQPTVEMAKRNSKQRVDPLIEESGVLHTLVSDPRSRDSGNTVLSKEFPGGVLVMTGANSAVGLRSMAARYLFLDEVDGYPGDVEGEGDPVVLASQKPFRDWMVEILACGLGYFTFEFGKLKVGSRINASAVEAFTLGNMLFQTLRLEPVEAAFEHLIIDFADQAYQYQANTAEYTDKDHAAYYGRAGAPLTARQHLVGCGTLSQALRLAVVRTREELGGINSTEWRNARVASFQTTILALNTEVGQVVSITHGDAPGGAGNFRIQSWRLKKDWSIEITAKTVTSSMYDLTVGPKPMDVAPAPLPGMFYAIPLGPMWAPYQIQAPAGDALFPGEWTFDSDQTYTSLADGSALASLAITGKLPVNEFSPGIGGPSIGTISQGAMGGSLPGGTTLRIALCAIDANGLPSTPSDIAIVTTAAGTSTNQIVLSGITWPAVAGLARYAVFVATQDDLICWQQGDVLTAGAGNTYTPGSITINGPLARSTWALPSPYVSKIRVKAKHVVHSGIVGVNVDSVTATTIVCSELVNPTTTFSAVGRIVSLIGRPESSTPFASFTITAYDKTTGTLTVTPSPITSGHPELSVQQNDTIVIRFKADAANTSNQTQITDSGCQNMIYANGMTPGAEVGNILRVIQGTGRGQLRKITGNTQTQLSWDLPLLLDTTSVWIVEAPAWDYSADSTAINNADPSHAVTLNVPTDNFVDTPLLIAGFTVDSNGNECPDGDVPIREDWIYGAEGQGSGFMLPVAGVLGIQSDAAPAFYLNGDMTPGAIKAYVKSAPVGADLTFSLYIGTSSTPYITLTIANGSKSVVATSDVIDALAPIPANTNVRLAITSVGTTYPGTDLTVFVYS